MLSVEQYCGSSTNGTYSYYSPVFLYFSPQGETLSFHASNCHQGNCRSFFPFSDGPENALSDWYLFYMLSKSVESLPTYLDINHLDMRQIDETESATRERRRRARVQVHWPVCFFRPGTTEIVKTVTQNLSSDGFYCLANIVFVPGEIRECTLGVPTYHPNSRDRARPVLCRVRIIRIEALGQDGLYGVGCRIEDYHFISPGNGHDRLTTAGMQAETRE